MSCSSQQTTDRVEHCLEHGHAILCFAFTEHRTPSTRFEICLNTTRHSTITTLQVEIEVGRNKADKVKLAPIADGPFQVSDLRGWHK
jgi:ribulose bisphosphate carboxylase small subunit